MGPERVVAHRFGRFAVTDQVRSNDGEVTDQQWHHLGPGPGAARDPVDEQEGGPRAGLHVGPAVPVDRDVLHAEGALAPDARPVANLHRVDLRVRVDSARLCHLRRGRCLTHVDLPCWFADSRFAYDERHLAFTFERALPSMYQRA